MPTLKADVVAALNRANVQSGNYTITSDNTATLTGTINADQLEELQRSLRPARMRAKLVAGALVISNVF